MATVYGESWVETAHTKVKAVLDDLVTDMASGYAPKIAASHGEHIVANLSTLPAVTVAVDSVDSLTQLWADTASQRYAVTLSIRVHTSYGIGDTKDYLDTLESARLLNSVANKLQQNQDLGDEYRMNEVRDIRNGVEFPESDSAGGSLLATVIVTISHTQE